MRTNTGKFKFEDIWARTRTLFIKSKTLYLSSSVSNNNDKFANL